MSGLSGHLVGVLILVLMITFIGIWVWAWRPRHRPVFDALARIPMLDNDPVEASAGTPARDAGSHAEPRVPVTNARETRDGGRPS
ncbi:MAG TPA: cbb3-type cytochrome c oxidase subunit 3 [Gammaproteobacteria bacterium]